MKKVKNRFKHGLETFVRFSKQDHCTSMVLNVRASELLGKNVKFVQILFDESVCEIEIIPTENIDYKATKTNRICYSINAFSLTKQLKIDRKAYPVYKTKDGIGFKYEVINNG